MITSALIIFPAYAPSPWLGYVKPSFPDYATSGMPDFDEKQDNWGPAPGVYTWCVPVAVANSLWWLDSKYESLLNPAPVPPPVISDHFSLVTPYGQWDDHDLQNVDPLVRTLAFLMDTDGQRTSDGHSGTRFTDVQSAIQQYLIMQGVATYFEVHNATYATVPPISFEWIDNETTFCQDVELFLDFWYWNGAAWTKGAITNPSLENGHCVTMAGSDNQTNQVLISDPWQDAFEAGLPGLIGGRSPVAHGYPHPSTVHNDAQYVSQDAYTVSSVNFGGPMPPPPGYPMTVLELSQYWQIMTGNPDPNFHTFIWGAIATSPLGVHDVAIADITTSKTGCTPMPTVGLGLNVTVNVTMANIGQFDESAVNVTVYANPSMPPAICIGSTTISLNAGESKTVTFSCNTASLSYGNHTFSAEAGPVAGETNTGDNTLNHDGVLVTIPGDINGNLQVTLQDLVFLANSYGSIPENQKWNPNADINNNKNVDLSDLVILANHYGQHYP